MARKSQAPDQGTLLQNLQTLADQIARKPPQHDPHWAKSITESFTLYTRTSTVNLFVSMCDFLLAHDWPFPAFLDLGVEYHLIARDARCFRWPPPFQFLFGWRSLSMAAMKLESVPWEEDIKRRVIDALLRRRFRRASKHVFRFWLAHPLLVSRHEYIKDLSKAYRCRLWGVCVPATFPLLDFLMRDLLGTFDITTGVGHVAAAFDSAGITYEAILPGRGVWDAHAKGNKHLADDLSRDLRLPGIYLASFVHFAQLYYARYTSGTQLPPHILNRHAILHGETASWSKTEAVKLLMFFDLALKLEPVLRIVLAPSPAPPTT